MSRRHVDDNLENAPLVAEAKPKIRAPKKFKVFLLNDDYTSMGFVVEVLQRFFQLNEEDAHRVMWKVHTEGRAVCGLFTKDIAETKTMLINEYAHIHEFPLMSGMEPD